MDEYVFSKNSLTLSLFSRYTFDMPHDEWGDGHLPLTYHKSAIDLKRIVKMCKAAGVAHFVLECGTTQLADIEEFLSYYI